MSDIVTLYSQDGGAFEVVKSSPNDFDLYVLGAYWYPIKMTKDEVMSLIDGLQKLTEGLK